MSTKSQDVTIWDESGDNATDVDADNDLHVKSKLWDGTDEVDVIDDSGTKRLATQTKITGNVIIVASRVEQPIHEYDGYNNNRTKISYTVPSGKVLYLQRLWASHLTDAVGHTIAFRTGTTQFYWMTFNNDGTTTFEKTYPESNPYGPISAGTTITAYRIDGSSSEEWTAGFDGYLEDT